MSCLSRVMGNYHARFLGGKGAARLLPYPVIGIFDLSPVMAAVVVWSHSIVLFLFSSQALEAWLKGHGLPSLPLVPVSSSQAVVGAIIGIGLLKGGRSIHWKTVAGITSGWIFTPIIAAIICLISLFFLQNVFQQDAYRQIQYNLDDATMEYLNETGFDTAPLQSLMCKKFDNAVAFQKAVEATVKLDKNAMELVLNVAEIVNLEITAEILKNLSFLIFVI